MAGGHGCQIMMSAKGPLIKIYTQLGLLVGR